MFWLPFIPTIHLTKKYRNGTGVKGFWFQTWSDEISQLFSPLTSLAHWGCFDEF